MRTIGVCAAIDHSFGVEVETHLESPQGSPQRSADLKAPGGYDSPLNRRPPGKVAFGQVHWEQALPISRQDRSGCQITPDRDYVIGPGCPRVGEPEHTGFGFDRQVGTFQRDATLPVVASSDGADSRMKAVVIGGGIAGISAAFHLARSGVDVAVLEQESTLAFHSTGRSAALYFEKYGVEPNRALTRSSREFFENPPVGLLDHLVLTRRGVLWVGRPDQVTSLRELVPRPDSSDPARWLDPDEAIALIPVLRPDLLGGAVWEPEALDLDVAAIHQGFVRGLRSAGASIVASCRVSTLRHRNGRWLVGADERQFEADVLVNAAGAWCDRVGALAGAMTIGLTPMRRTAFTVPGNDAWTGWPLICNVDNEFYVRPDGSQLLCSLAEENPTEPCDARPDQIDVALAIDRINTHTTLDIRVVRSSWTGLRSFVADRAMVIGFDPVAPNFFWLAGQGGTGIQTAPAAGELTAALITTGKPPERLLEFGVDTGALSPTRLQGQSR